jgi:hypothetical protein
VFKQTKSNPVQASGQLNNDNFSVGSSTVSDAVTNNIEPKGVASFKNKRAGPSSAADDTGTDASLSLFSMKCDENDSDSANETDGGGKISDSSCEVTDVKVIYGKNSYKCDLVEVEHIQQVAILKDVRCDGLCGYEAIQRSLLKYFQTHDPKHLDYDEELAAELRGGYDSIMLFRRNLAEWMEDNRNKILDKKTLAP